jgi:hypothetical protein
MTTANQRLICASDDASKTQLNAVFHADRNQSKIIAEQLLADLLANRRERLSLADVYRIIEGTHRWHWV